MKPSARIRVAGASALVALGAAALLYAWHVARPREIDVVDPPSVPPGAGVGREEGPAREEIAVHPARRPPHHLDDVDGLQFATDLSFETYWFAAGVRSELGEGDWHFASRLSWNGTRGQAGLEILDAGGTGPSAGGAAAVADSRGTTLGFRLDRDGRMAGFALAPERSDKTASIVRALARLHVPVVFSEGGRTTWTFASDLDDSLLAAVHSRWSPSAGASLASPGSMVVRATWGSCQPTGSQDSYGAGWPLLEIEHFTAVALDAGGASRIYRGSFLLGPDGFPVAGEAWYAEVTRSTRITHVGIDARAWIVRRGFDARGIRETLEARAAGARERLLANLPAVDAPPPEEMFAEDDRALEPPPEIFPIAIVTDTVADILAVFEEVWPRIQDPEFRGVLRELARVAAGDPAVLDRLLQIAEAQGDLPQRKLAVIVLGLTERQDVRLKLFDLAEDPDEELALRELAMDCVFAKRDSGLVAIGEDRLQPGTQPVGDPVILDRAIRATQRSDLPKAVLLQALAGLSAAQELSSEGVDNRASRRLREAFESMDDAELKRQIVASLASFPSRENVSFLVEFYRSHAGTPLATEVARHMNAGIVNNAELRDWMSEVILELAGSAARPRDAEQFLGKVAHTPATNARILALARDGILQPAQPGENSNEFYQVREGMVSVLSGFATDEEFAPKSRAILADLRERMAGDPRMAQRLDSALAFVDRTIERMRPHWERTRGR
ncbi:MAG: hypothetical protein HY720_16295 [Planctomycetes bacterium]|nr:hypothetical protein [Planctomycetota bacterium]